MAKLVIVIDSPESIAQIKQKIDADASKPFEGMNELRNYLDSMIAGVVDASAQVTIRDTDPSVATSGSGSVQKTYNLK